MATEITTIDNQFVVTTETFSDWASAGSSNWHKFIAGKKPETVKTYDKALKIFFNFLARNGYSYVDEDSVNAFRENLLATVKPNTGKLYIAVLKRFVKWLASRGKCSDFTASIDSISDDSPTHARDALTIDDTKKLFSSLKAKNTSEKASRDLSMIMTMAVVGLRTIEITRLDVGDIEIRRGKFFAKIFGKGRNGKVDSVQVPPQCIKLIVEYLKKRSGVSTSFSDYLRKIGKDKSSVTDYEKWQAKSKTVLSDFADYLYKNKKSFSEYVNQLSKQKGANADYIDYLKKEIANSPLYVSTSRSNKFQRLQTQTVSRVTKAALRAINLDSERLSAHSLRHTYAMTALALGVDVAFVQANLRHKNPSTTQIYRHDLDALNNDSTCKCADSILGGLS